MKRKIQKIIDWLKEYYMAIVYFSMVAGIVVMVYLAGGRFYDFYYW